MEQQIKQFEDKIGKAYDSIKTEPYHLHAVIIHEGNATSGHYYCYVKDQANNQWLKFSDIQTKVVKEEEVLKEAEGGSGWRSAYWLVYVNHTIYNKQTKMPLYAYNKENP